MNLEQLFIDRAEEVTEKGNLPIVCGVEELELDVKFDKLLLGVYVEELDTMQNFSIHPRVQENGAWVETEESIARCNEDCQNLFGVDYEEVMDIEDDIEEVKLYLSPNGTVLRGDYEPRKTYDKLTKAVKIAKPATGKVISLTTDETGVEMIIGYDGEKEGGEYKKKWNFQSYKKRTGKWRNCGQTRKQAKASMLTLFGTAEPEFVEGSEVTFFTETRDNINQGKPFFKFIKITGYEDQVEAFENYCEEIGYDDLGQKEQFQKRLDYLETLGQLA